MLTELSALLDVLRAKGVTSYRGDLAVKIDDVAHFGRVELILAPSAAATDETKPDKPEAKTPDPDVCSCGHGIHEHQGALCLLGCDEEKCGVKS